MSSAFFGISHSAQGRLPDRARIAESRTSRSTDSAGGVERVRERTLYADQIGIRPDRSDQRGCPPVDPETYWSHMPGTGADAIHLSFGIAVQASRQEAISRQVMEDTPFGVGPL
jgi:hypothetical protein